MASPGVGDPESRVGTVVAGRYFIQHFLARGGMGDVYNATLLGSGLPVALKLLAMDPEGGGAGVARRFEREAVAAARLHHPNVVELLDYGTAQDGAPYIAMELVPGRTLAQVIAAEAPLPPARAVHLLAQVLEALGEAHANGIIHRDLKPANVMVDTQRDAAGFVKVLDFGIAVLGEGREGEDPRLTREGVVHGTPAYMSPEQIRGEPLDARSDLYSAGVLLFELLAGSLPFEAPSAMGLAARHLTDPAPALRARRPGVAAPPALEAVVARALEKDPALRPASAGEMRAALVASVAGSPGPVQARSPAALPPTEALPRIASGARPRSSGRRRGAAAAVATVAALLAAGLIVRGAGGAAREQGVERPAEAAPQVHAGDRAATVLPAEAPPSARQRSAPVPSAPAAAGVAPEAVPRRRAAPSAPVVPPITLPPATVQLVRGELNSVATPSSASGDGVLVLVATPWAEVSVDGIHLGETPRELLLRAGTYGVRAVHPELGERVERVVVKPGERKLWAARYEP